MFSLVLLDLTFRQIVAGIPHDAGAVVAFGIVGVFIALIWQGSRPKSASRARHEPHDREYHGPE